MNGLTYTRFELLRTVRSRRFFVFSLGFPLILYYVIASPNRHGGELGNTGLSVPLYFMVSLSAFGAMNAVLSAGARIAGERSVGWNRQLRLTPLSPRAYFRAKVATGYLMALLSLLLLDVAGATLGVSMPVGRWLHMTWMILVGLIPFVALGIVLGHLLTTDSIGPVMGGTTAVFALLGGFWFPIGDSGVFHDVVQGLPSYWLVQAGRIGIGGSGWGTTGWIVVAAWAVVLIAAARRAYARDTNRV